MRLSWAAGPGCCALPVSHFLPSPDSASCFPQLLLSLFSLSLLPSPHVLDMPDLENSNRNWGRGRAKPSP